MSSDTSATPKVSNVQFDPDGDVILVLRSEDTTRRARFQVNSNSLCLASSVFRAMLGPHFKEGTALRSRDGSSPPIEVTLADDDPRALALVLRIVHLQCDWVPRTLNDEQLFQVAILADKYDLRRALGLSIDHWIPMDSQAGANYNGDKWLFISYALDRGTLFTQLSRELIQTSSVVHGSLVANVKQRGELPVYSPPFNSYLPHSIIAEIQARQQEVLTEMYRYLHKTVQAYLASSPQCAHSTKSASCDTFFLGLLQKGFNGLNICPKHEYQAKAETGSLQYLKSIVDSLSTPECISFAIGGVNSNSTPCRCPHIPSIDGVPVKSAICPRCRGLIINHANTCSPIPEIKLHIEAEYEAIQGLELAKFRRNSKNDKSKIVTVGQDLWDYLEYE